VFVPVIIRTVDELIVCIEASIGFAFVARNAVTQATGLVTALSKVTV
jgi:hypothetical protein